MIGHSHERDGIRVFRLSRIRGKVSYASKAEHDFSPPEKFERRDYARRAEWQLGETEGEAKIFLRDRVAWLVERDFGAYGEFRNPGRGDGSPARAGSSRPSTPRAARWSPGCSTGASNATVLDPPELAEEVAERLELLIERHCARLRARRSGADRAAGAAGGAHKRPLGVVDSPGALRPPGDPRGDADRVRQGRGAPARRRRQGAS